MQRTWFFKSSRKGVLNRHRTTWTDFVVECSCPGWHHGKCCWHADRVARAEMEAWQEVKALPWPRWYCGEEEWERLSPTQRASAMAAFEKENWEESCR